MNKTRRKFSPSFSISASSALIGVLLLSVLLRGAVAFYYGDVVDAPPLLTDQRSYHWLAIRLLEGEGFSFPRAWYPFTPAETPTAHWSFLYSLIVAAVYSIFGPHPLAMRLFQAVAGGILLPLMVYRLTRTLFTDRAPSPPHPLTPSPFPTLPLIAAACAAVYGYFILYAATIMTETFTITALLWSLERALRIAQTLRAERRIPWSLALQLGLSLGVATLLRQSILPWVPVLFLWLLLNVITWTRAHVATSAPNHLPTTSRSHVPPSPPLSLSPSVLLPSLARLFVAGLILLACIAPFTLRNYRVYGEFLLLNSNTGYAMYSAQHPFHGTRFQEFEAAPVPSELEGLNEAQMDKILLRQGFRFILEDPGRYLLLSLSRVRAYFEFWPTPDSTLIHNLGRTGSFGLFLPFMLYGLYLHLKPHRPAPHLPTSAPPPPPASPPFHVRTLSRYHVITFARLLHYLLRPSSLLILFMLFYTLMHILTWAMVRYRLPVDAVLLPFAALALQDLGQRLWTLMHADKR